MKYSLLFYLVRLALCFGVSSGCYLLLWIASVIWKPNITLMPPEYMTSNVQSENLRRRLTDGLWPVLMRWTVRVAVLVSVFIIGYATRDLQSYRSTVPPRLGDLIIERHTPTSYRMLSAAGVEFEVTLCPASRPVDWSPGNKLQSWSYEQKSGCKLLHDFVAVTDRRTGDRVKFDVPILRKEEIADVRR